MSSMYFNDTMTCFHCSLPFVSHYSNACLFFVFELLSGFCNVRGFFFRLRLFHRFALCDFVVLVCRVRSRVQYTCIKLVLLCEIQIVIQKVHVKYRYFV